MITRILFPADYSEPCRTAAALVRSLAERTGAAVTVLHVMEMPERRMADWLAYLELSSVRERLREERRRFEAFFHGSFDGLPKPRFVFRHGDPAVRIIETAARRRADLIVMPTRGMGVYRRLLIGSVAAKVLHDAACPVLTIGENAVVGGEGPIVCAVDSTDAGSQVARRALALAKALRRPVRFAHVLEAGEGEEWAMERLHGFGGELEPAVLHGSLEDELYSLSAELLVIGHGRIGAPFGRLRSNAYAIIRDAPWPVVSV